MATDFTRETNEIIMAGGGVQSLEDISTRLKESTAMKNPDLTQYEAMEYQLDNTLIQLSNIPKKKADEYGKNEDFFGTIKGVAELNEITPSKHV